YSFVSVWSVAIVYALITTPIYHAEIKLASAQGSPGYPLGITAMVAQLPTAFRSIARLAGMGRTGSGLNQRKRGETLVSLTSSIHVQEFIESNNLLPILFDDLWDPVLRRWTVDSDDNLPTLSDGYELFISHVDANEDPLTGIVSLTVEWKDPVIAAQWANGLVETLNSSLRARAINKANRTIEFLNQELERTRVVELRQALFFMIEQQIAERTSASVQSEYVYKVIDPALAADLSKFSWPNRRLIIFAGFVLGIAAALTSTFLAYVSSYFRAEAKRRSGKRRRMN
ncbi:MAG: hypothetical protein ACR2P6_04180, partial [Gammaproteobacteria bacterium]